LYSHRSAHGPVDLSFTDRHDGVSASPYDALNLARVTGSQGDASEAIAENWRLLLADFAPDGAALADMQQVHGADVAEASAEADTSPTCDGIVSDRPDVVLAVRVADCVPVLLADPVAGVIGAAHAGRLGVEKGVVPATVARMRDLGATDITAWIGPHICGGCYEVPQSMQDEVAAIEPATRATTTWGTPSLALGAGVRAQLERDGVTVVEVAPCTRETEALYSHRRDGAGAGRLAGLIRIRP
jgi:YfiH family protein